VRPHLSVAAPTESADELFFRSAYERHFDAVKRYIRRLSGDVTSSEDIAQEVFVRLWRQLVRDGSPPNVRAWVYRVASNLVIGGFRHRIRALRRLLPFSARDEKTADLERDVAQRQIVERVLAKLPEPMRQCLLLHHEGLTAAEIGEVLCIKPSYVRTLVFRAHERFRRECEALVGNRDDLLR
jgi:RNA polymerase sigma factor (sigma-70 family)